MVHPNESKIRFVYQDNFDGYKLKLLCSFLEQLLYRLTEPAVEENLISGCAEFLVFEADVFYPMGLEGRKGLAGKFSLKGSPGHSLFFHIFRIKDVVDESCLVGICKGHELSPEYHIRGCPVSNYLPQGEIGQVGDRHTEFYLIEADLFFV